MTVSEDKKKNLTIAMSKIDLKEADFEEKFIKASGSGGQKVNKSNTCVWLKHLPTGLEVKCQRTRSLADNRFFARKRLFEKFKGQVLGEQLEADRKRAKLRKQKARRSRKTKLKVRKQKEQRSTLKKTRGKISE